MVIEIVVGARGEEAVATIIIDEICNNWNTGTMTTTMPFGNTTNIIDDIVDINGQSFELRRRRRSRTRCAVAVVPVVSLTIIVRESRNI